MTEQTNENAESKLIGLMAQFDDPDTLVHACDKAREDGFKHMDAYSPFPVHGIDPAIGIGRTKLPFFVLAVALGAVVVGVGLQWYTNATDHTFSSIFPGYKFNISGKPYWSLPANIPVVFEIIVLSSAFATFFGMWILGFRKPTDKLATWKGLPQLANPLHRISRFKRATNDRFFLVIDSDDPKFDRSGVEAKFNEWGASAVEEVQMDMTDQELPQWMKLAGVIGLIFLLIPPIVIYRASGMTNRAPRLHFMPDMDWQIKFKSQTVSPNLANQKKAKDYLFEDFRSMRDQIPGTIARGDLEVSTEYNRGIQAGSSAVTANLKTEVRTGLNQDKDEATPAAADPAANEPNWVTSFPSEVTIDEALLKRGKQRFEIYCSACHGYDGNGQGLVNKRAMALNSAGQAAWTTAKSLHDPTVKANAVGRIFDTISNGRGTMGPYSRQITVEDRWAIVAYVRALQATGIQPETTTVNADADTEAESGETSTQP